MGLLGAFGRLASFSTTFMAGGLGGLCAGMAVFVAAIRVVRGALTWNRSSSVFEQVQHMAQLKRTLGLSLCQSIAAAPVSA